MAKQLVQGLFTAGQQATHYCIGAGCTYCMALQHNGNDDCKCGQGTHHVFHCARCTKPIVVDNVGIVTKDGSTHNICASPEEVSTYMALSLVVHGLQATRQYMLQQQHQLAQLERAAQHAASLITDWTSWLHAHEFAHMQDVQYTEGESALHTVVVHWYKRNFRSNFITDGGQ